MKFLYNLFIFFREFNYLIQCTDSIDNGKIEESFNSKEFKYLEE